MASSITGLPTVAKGRVQLRRIESATAMRMGQRGLMDDPNTSHPYYWSAFAIVGDGQRPLLPVPAAAAEPAAPTTAAAPEAPVAPVVSTVKSSR